MSIHIELVDMHGSAPFKEENKKITVFEHEFESVKEALDWWKSFRLYTGLEDDSVKGVLEACATEYVGTEHELTNEEGDYTSMVLCIEGQVDTKTYDQRLPDLYVDEIIYMGDRQYQLNGHTGHGANKKTTWMTVHLNSDLIFRPSKVIDLPE